MIPGRGHCGRIPAGLGERWVMRLERQFILDKARPLMYANYLVFFSGQWEAVEMSYQGSDIVIFHFAKMSLKAVWEIDCRDVRSDVSGPARRDLQ